MVALVTPAPRTEEKANRNLRRHTDRAPNEWPRWLLTEPEAASLLGISTRGLRELRYQGKVAYVRVGKRKVRYDPDALRAWVESQTEGPVS